VRANIAIYSNSELRFIQSAQTSIRKLFNNFFRSVTFKNVNIFYQNSIINPCLRESVVCYHYQATRRTRVRCPL